MQICVCMNFLLWNMIGKRSQRTRSAAATLIRWWVNAGSTMRVPTDTILKACPITLILDKLNNQYTSSLWYFNVHPKLQLQTHPIVKSKSWTLPRQHLCSADDDAVRPCCWSFTTISFFLWYAFRYIHVQCDIIIFTIHSSCCDRQFLYATTDYFFSYATCM